MMRHATSSVVASKLVTSKSDCGDVNTGAGGGDVSTRNGEDVNSAARPWVKHFGELREVSGARRRNEYAGRDVGGRRLDHEDKTCLGVSRACLLRLSCNRCGFLCLNSYHSRPSFSD